jgi:hypothetical protein
MSNSRKSNTRYHALVLISIYFGLIFIEAKLFHLFGYIVGFDI